MKSRGYRHIIFYGEAATKGAYCLDPQSVRFFFGANQDIPLPVGANPLEKDAAGKRAGVETAGNQPRTEAAPRGPASKNDLAGMVRRRRSVYHPGDFSRAAATDNNAATSNAAATDNNAAATDNNAGTAPQSAPATVRYSYRDISSC